MYRETIPWRRVFVTPLLGFGARAFTTTLPPFAPVELGYALNVGAEGYAGMERSRRLRGLLIHELAHVRQGEAGLWSSAFMLRSIWCQTWAAIRRGSAYDYAPGREWGEYGVEQQASIVEDWYLGGEREDDALYRYVRDHVRGRP